MKSKLKQRLKAIEKKLANFDNRLVNLELPNIEVNVDELNELPEKWEVLINEENREALNNYRMNVCGIKYRIPFKYKRMACNGTGNDEGNGSFTLISFSDFERLVLNKTELEVGRWYKDTDMKKRLIYVTKKHGEINQNNSIEGYGIDGAGNWSVYKDGFYAGSHDIVAATEKEAEEALKKEAKKRGFVSGVKFINAYDKETHEYARSAKIELHEYKGKPIVYCDGQTIFYDGIWAEIVEQPEEIDFKHGSLFSYMGSDMIIILHLMCPDEKSVYGTVIQTDDKYTWAILGEFKEWDKNKLSPFKGELTIKNN